jgi:predicted ATPase
MWGGVGRGKTWLMDLFYQSLPGRKQRLHFHRFMLRVHEELTALQGKAIRWRLWPTLQGGNGRALLSMSFLFLISPTPCC